MIVFNRYTRDHVPWYLSNIDDKRTMKALQTSVYSLQACVYFRVCVSAGAVRVRRTRAQFCLHVKRCDFTPLEIVSLNIKIFKVSLLPRNWQKKTGIIRQRLQKITQLHPKKKSRHVKRLFVTQAFFANPTSWAPILIWLKLGMRRRTILDLGSSFFQISFPDPSFLLCPKGTKTLGTN